MNGATVLLIATTFLFASCQKEENLTPSTNVTSFSSENMSTNALKPDGKINNNINPSYYVLVSIKHQPGKAGQTPEYIVSLDNAGKVIFQGRNGVTHIGVFNYKISADKLSKIQQLLSSSFYSINENFHQIPKWKKYLPKTSEEIP